MDELIRTPPNAQPLRLSCCECGETITPRQGENWLLCDVCLATYTGEPLWQRVTHRMRRSKRNELGLERAVTP